MEGTLTNPIRLLLVDHHAMLRAGLRLLIDAERDILVVGEAGSAEEAVEMATVLHPAVVLADLITIGSCASDTTRRLLEGNSLLRVLALTTPGQESLMRSMLAAGGSGYVMKHCSPGELMDAIRAVASSAAGPVAECIVRTGSERLAGCGTDWDSLALLSDRERDVLALTAAGFSASEVGARLGIGLSSVDSYRQRMMKKLNLLHRTDVVRFALRTGLLHAGVFQP